ATRPPLLVWGSQRAGQRAPVLLPGRPVRGGPGPPAGSHAEAAARASPSTGYTGAGAGPYAARWGKYEVIRAAEAVVDGLAGGGGRPSGAREALREVLRRARGREPELEPKRPRGRPRRGS